MRKEVERIFGLIVLLSSSVVSAQSAQKFRTLVINDHSGKVAVLELGDRTYVDLNRLVQIGHGSVDFAGNQIVLSLTCSDRAPTPKPVETDQAAGLRFSRQFAKAGIEEISLMREWASALANAVQNGYPVAETWLADYRGRAQSGLGMASAAVESGADRDGFQLLSNEFEAVKEWSDKLLEARKSLDAAKYAVSPNALQNDPLSQKIVSCGRSIGQMLAIGEFQDSPACH